MNIDSFETKLELPKLDDIKIEYEEPIFNEDKIDDAEEDYKFLRNKLRFFLATGEFILLKSINALNADPSPRMIEASSLILRNILKISEKTLNLHKETKLIMKKEEIKEKTNDEDKNKITTSLVDIIEEINKIEIK